MYSSYMREFFTVVKTCMGLYCVTSSCSPPGRWYKCFRGPCDLHTLPRRRQNVPPNTGTPLPDRLHDVITQIKINLRFLYFALTILTTNTYSHYLQIFNPFLSRKQKQLVFPRQLQHICMQHQCETLKLYES